MAEEKQPKKKGTRTPTRREAEAARQRPLVPKDRKLARQIEKQKRNEAYAREQEALQTGDERYLPYRDKGRVRRFTRDWLDARWSASEFLFPVMLILLVAMLAVGFFAPNTGGTAVVSLVFIAVLYGMFAISIIEAIIVWTRLKKRIRTRYPDDTIPKGTWFYAYSRMLMARRWRTPKPQVARGEFPRTTPSSK